MTLRELMGNGVPEVEISALAYRSSSVTPGTLFFCVRGFTSDGHDFAPDAVERGAVALVCERPLGLGVPEVIVPDVRAAMPEAIDLQAAFRRMLDEGDRACAMEVSSHALDLGRAEGIEFACRVFTNLTQDHLDFHNTMESYYLAKRRLFDDPGPPSVVNLDDDYGRRLAGEIDA